MPEVQANHAARLDVRDLLREGAAFLERLPTKQRLALILRRYHALGYAEIAAILTCSEGTARANVHQALRTLRDRFGDRR